MCVLRVYVCAACMCVCCVCVCVCAVYVHVCVQHEVSVAELGERCPNRQIRHAVKAMGWFCGRYKLDRRPEHSTETCVVYLATEFVINNTVGRRVAIKLMSDQAQYENEIAVRKGIDTRFLRTSHTHTYITQPDTHRNSHTW